MHIAFNAFVDFLCKHGAVCNQGNDLTKWFYDLEFAAVWALAPPVALFVLGVIVYVIVKAARGGEAGTSRPDTARGKVNVRRWRTFAGQPTASLGPATEIRPTGQSRQILTSTSRPDLGSEQSRQTEADTAKAYGC